MITRKIWMYWDQGWEQAPDLVTHCKNSWSELNPDFELHLLDKDTLFDYIDLQEVIDIKRKDLTIQKITVLARLALLSEYGGVWADGTTMCTQPLSEWLEEYYGCHFFAFRNPGKDRLMANWMIAAEPDSIILQRLHKSFTDFYANNYFSNMGTAHGEKMLEYLGRHWNKNSKNSIKWHHWLVRKVLRVYPYFIFHYTFNKLILQDSECAKLWNETKALSADPPHRVQHLESKPDNIVQAKNVIDAGTTPVHKLNWRVDSSNHYWSTILPYFRHYNT
jgi:mannosyltransferase OCH1-like enzyme